MNEENNNAGELWIGSSKDFTKSLKAISDVEKLLSCTSCGDMMEKIVTLWSCGHIFCQNCVEDMDKCLVCNLPAWAEDQKENKTVANIASLCKSLKELLQSYMEETKRMTSTTGVDSTVQKDTASTPTYEKSGKLHEILQNKNVDDIIKSTVMIDDMTASVHETESFEVSKMRKSTKDSTTLQDVSNIKEFSVSIQGFSTPPPLKRKRSSINKICVTPNNSKMRFTSPARSPACKTPKSTKKNKRGETPLHIAAIKGRLEEVLNLIKEGVDINVKDNAGWTPLHEACNHGHYNVVQELLDARALVNMPGYDNQTPLIDAVTNGHLDIVQLLLEHGANPNLRDMNGKTATYFAVGEDIRNMLEEYSTGIKHAVSSEEELPDYAPEDIILSHSSSVSISSVKKCAKVLKAQISSNNVANATHLIVSSFPDGRCPRTLKYMQMVARGAWIVQCDWIEACTVTGGWVNEHSFEIIASKDDVMTGGPKRSRLNHAPQFPGIFHGCHFYFAGSFHPPGLTKVQLGEIVQLADGIVLTREPKPDSDCVQLCTKVPYHANAGTAQYYYTFYIVYDPAKGKTPRLVHRGKVCSVPVSWILDCVSQFFLMEIPR